MTFTAKIEATNLAKALAQCAKIGERRDHIPILACARLVPSERGLRIDATNMDQWLSIEAGGEASGDPLAVPLAKLRPAVSDIGPTVELSAKGEMLSIKGERGSARMMTLPVAEWPEPKAVEPKFSLEIDAKTFGKAGSAALAHVGTEDSRQWFCGVNIKGASFEATNANRLIVCKLSESKLSGVSPKDGVIVPTAAMRCAVEQGGDVKIASDHALIDFVGAGWRLTSRLLDYKMPDFGRIIPTDAPKRLVVDAADLREAINRIAWTGGEKLLGTSIVFEPEHGLLRLRTDQLHADQAVAETTCPADLVGPAAKVAFASRTILPSLAVLSGDITLSWVGNLSPVRFDSADDDSLTVIVLPFRFTDQEELRDAA